MSKLSYWYTQFVNTLRSKGIHHDEIITAMLAAFMSSIVIICMGLLGTYLRNRLFPESE